MRYAIFSDIHANAQAWSRVAEDADAVGVDVFVCLGDVVGYGPKPGEVLDAIRRRTANFVLGNHDAAVTGALDASLFNDQARSVVEWTRTQLDAEALAFLSEVPLAIEDGEILFVHGEVESPGRFHYIEDAVTAAAHLAATEHRLVFLGHTHHPAVFAMAPTGSVSQAPDQDFALMPGHRYLINVGTVGEPRDPDDIRARYVIYDSSTGAVYFRRLEFDTDAYRADLDSSGLSIRPYFLQVLDHQVHAEAGSGHAMVREMRAPVRPAVVEKRLRTLVIEPVPATKLPAPAPRPKTPQPMKFLALAAGLAILLGVVAWAIRKSLDSGAHSEIPPAWEMLILNGGFESPRIEGNSKIVPTHWEASRPDTVELAGRTAGAFQRFDSAEGSQVLSLLPGGTLFQPVGKAALRPGATYAIRFHQYEQTDIRDGGGGIRAEIWEGNPAKGGRLLSLQEFSATGEGVALLRIARLRAPETATSHAELFFCLRNIPDPDTAAIGNVSLDAVQYGMPEPD